MKKIATLAFLFLFPCTLMAAGDDATKPTTPQTKYEKIITFRGVSMNASEKEFTEKVKGFTCRDARRGDDLEIENYYDRVCEANDDDEKARTYVEEDADISVFFIKDKLKMVFIYFSNSLTSDSELISKSNKVRQSLSDRFGYPNNYHDCSYHISNKQEPSAKDCQWQKTNGKIKDSILIGKYISMYSITYVSNDLDKKRWL